MVNQSDRVLYWGSGSAPAWRVLAALTEKGLPFESKMVEFSKGGHKSPEVLALNPRGQVPTFKDGEVVVNESLAALLYLEKTYPEPALAPKDPAGYGKVLQRTLEADVLAGAFKDVGRPVIRGLIKTDEDKAAWLEKVEAAKKELGYWETYLKEDAFIAGPNVTLADFALAPWLAFGLRFGASYEAFPKIQAYTEKMKAWPSIAKTSPPHWAESDRQMHLTGHF